MKAAKKERIDDELRPEYGLSTLKGRVQGKYAQAYREGANVVLLEPDVAKYFRSAEAVNEARRSLVNIAKAATKVGK